MLHLLHTIVVKVAQNWRWRLAQYLEIRWWRRYLRRKPQATYLANKKAYWERVLQQLDFLPQEKQPALEIGCGPAGLFVLLHERQKITALDPLLDQYEAQLAHFSGSDYPEVNFLAIPMEKARFKPGSFAVIYCFNAINHVDDWEACLDQLTKAAGPGAQLLLSSDAHRYRWLRTVFRYLPGDALHPHQHTAKEYRDALQQRGWQIEKEATLKPGKVFNYVAWKLSKP